LYLEPWMITTLILAFGICAYTSNKIGARRGILFTLSELVRRDIITIQGEKIMPGKANIT
jgi:hypothetical protein